MGLKYTKRAMTSYEVHRFFHGLEISFFPDTFLCFIKIMYQNKMYIFNESSKTHEHKLQMDH